MQQRTAFLRWRSSYGRLLVIPVFSVEEHMLGRLEALESVDREDGDGRYSRLGVGYKAWRGQATLMPRADQGPAAERGLAC